MLGNFTYCNPTKLYFGNDSVNNLKAALKSYKKIMLVYGGGSIKKTGLYDKIIKIIRGICDGYRKTSKKRDRKSVV